VKRGDSLVVVVVVGLFSSTQWLESFEYVVWKRFV